MIVSHRSNETCCGPLKILRCSLARICLFLVEVASQPSVYDYGKCFMFLLIYEFTATSAETTRFLFHKEPISRPSIKSSLKFLLLSIVTGNIRTKESIVFTRNFSSRFLINSSHKNNACTVYYIQRGELQILLYFYIYGYLYF